MGDIEKHVKIEYIKIVGPICIYWLWEGQNRVDAAEISRNQSPFNQKELSGSEASHS